MGPATYAVHRPSISVAISISTIMGCLSIFTIMVLSPADIYSLVNLLRLGTYFFNKAEAWLLFQCQSLIHVGHSDGSCRYKRARVTFMKIFLFMESFTIEMFTS